MDMENQAAMEVLKEIKSLMDSRLGDMLSKKEEPMEPKIEEMGEAEDSMDPNEEEELKKVRMSMME